MTADGEPDVRVPEYLGRVLDNGRDPVGTCFQVADGVLATAWHVLDDAGAAEEGANVWVDPLAGGATFKAAVARLDQARDLAVLTCASSFRSRLGAWLPPTWLGPGPQSP